MQGHQHANMHGHQHANMQARQHGIYCQHAGDQHAIET
jgi:hypothetical protein